MAGHICLGCPFHCAGLDGINLRPLYAASGAKGRRSGGSRLTPHAAVSITPGVDYFPGFFDRAAQEALRDEVLAILEAAPPFRPRMPRTAKPFSVLMSNCGSPCLGSDEAGLLLHPTRPET